MGSHLTKENYRARIADLTAAARRDVERGAILGAARYYELIGNVCWHFAQGEAAPWFRSSLDLRRRSGSKGWQNASLLWKMGDREGLLDECRNVVSAAIERADSLTDAREYPTLSKRREHERQVQAAYLDAAVGAFFAGDFSRAREWAQKGLSEDERWATWDGARTEKPNLSLAAVNDVSTAIQEGSPEALARVLNELRRRLPAWPTDAGSIDAELYRYGQALADSLTGR